MELEEVLNTSLRNANDEEKEKIYNFLVSSKVEDFPKKYLRKICEQSIEMLKFKGRQRSSDLDSDRSENELLGNLRKRIQSLEDDRRVLKGKIKELSGENSRLQRNGIGLESDKDSTDPLSELDRYEDLLKNISTKNKHIKKLLKDIESFQHKELQHSKKIKALEDKLESSNMRLEDFQSNFNLQASETKHFQKTIDELNTDISRLENNVKFLEKERDNADDEFKEFIRKLEERAVIWRNIIVDKDKQLDSLQCKIRDFQSNTSLERRFSNEEDDSKRNAELMEAIEERNAVIEQLESKIHEMTTEMTLSSEIWNNMTSSKNPSINKKACDSCENLENALNKSLRRARELSELLQKSEEDNFLKSKQAMDALNALESYQRGEDGLTSALDRISSLEFKLQSREKQVKSLVSELNSLNEISQENTILRKKLNIPDDMIIATTNLKAKEKNKDKIISRLNLKLKASEEMRLQLKIEKHELSKTISLLKSEPSIPSLNLRAETSSESSHRSQQKEEIFCENCLKSIHIHSAHEKDDSLSKDWESKHSQISEENENLRAGMFEILEKIQEFDEASDTIILDSFILERLIQSLNVRTTNRFRSSDPGDLIGIKAREIALREKIDLIDKSVSSDKLEDIVDDTTNNVADHPTPEQILLEMEKLSERNRNLELEIEKLKIYELNFSELQKNLSQNESDLTKYCTTLVEKLTDLDVQFTSQSKKYKFLLEDFEKSEKDHKNSEYQKISLIADLKRQINDLKSELSLRSSSKISEHKESVEFRKLRENIQKQQLQITNLLDLVFSGKAPDFKITEISSEYGVIDEKFELGYITAKELESLNLLKEKEENTSRSLKESLKNLEKQLNISEEENSSLKSLLAEINDQHIDLRHLIADLQSTSDEKYLLTKSRQELSSAKLEIQSLKSERQVLEETIKEMKFKMSDAEQILKSALENKEDEDDSNKIKLKFLEKSLFDLKTKFFKFTPLIFLTNFVYSYAKFIKKNKLEYESVEMFLKNLNDKIEKIPDGGTKDVVQLVKYKSKCDYLENQMVLLGKRLEALEKDYQEQRIQMAEESEHWKTIEVLFGDSEKKTFVEQKENQSQTESTKMIHVGVNTDEILETPSTTKRKTSIVLSPIERADKATSPPASRPTSGKRSPKATVTTLENKLQESEKLAHTKSNILAETENKLIETQARVREMENTIDTLKTLLHANNEKQPENKDGDVSEKTSSTLLETTINSFKTMLQEKDSTLSHYQELLKIEREETSKIKSQLEKEHKSLNEMEQQLQAKTLEVQELTSKIQELATRKKSVEKREIAVGKDEEDDNGNEMSDEKIEELFQTDVEEPPEDMAKEELQQLQKILKDKDEENVLLRKRVIILQSRCKDEPDVAQLKAIIDEKDMHINELMETLTNFHDDQQQYMEETSSYSPNQFVHLETNLTRSETTNKILQTQIEALRRQVATLSVREKQARDLANSLKTQLIKRPVVSIKSSPSSADTTKSQKENFQKKVCQLEAELESSKDEVKKLQAVIEAKRAKSASEVNLWEKQKKWQQTAEKLKQKLEETETSLEKSRGLLNSARTTINRLEKDKHFLEAKLGKGAQTMMGKCCKTPSCPNLLKYCESPDSFTCTSECSSPARASSAKMMSTNNELVETLKARNEFLQRRIMAMEASEGHGENILSQEIHKLHENFSSLEAENVRLEARNLHLQLEVDMKGQGTDCNDRLQKRITHLEDYIIALKEEMGRLDAQRELKGCSNKQSVKSPSLQGADQTILVLKRVVEKLRAENKHLKEHSVASTSSNCPDINRLQQMYAESQSMVACLQEQLKDNDLVNELRATKDQLVKKTQLLEKAKILLTRAAAKENVLKEQLTLLKRRCSELQNFPVIDEISE